MYCKKRRNRNKNRMIPTHTMMGCGIPGIKESSHLPRIIITAIQQAKTTNPIIAEIGLNNRIALSMKPPLQSSSEKYRTR
jgi:hypothetical protein